VDSICTHPDALANADCGVLYVFYLFLHRSEMKRFVVGASHDTGTAERLFHGLFGEETMAECSSSPLVFVTAAGVSFMPAQMYLFRNYELRQDAFSKVRPRSMVNVGMCVGMKEFAQRLCGVGTPSC